MILRAEFAEAPSSGGADYCYAAPSAEATEYFVNLEQSGAPNLTLSFRPARSAVPNAFTEILPTVNPRRICVVVKGSAFFIDADDLKHVQSLTHSGSIVGAQKIDSAEIILLQTPWQLLAVGELGALWTTRRIAIDGFEIVELTSTKIHGTADSGDMSKDFTVNLSDGALEGGTTFD